MSAGVTTIAMFAPIVASNAVFSARRATRGVNAIEDNPVYAAMNFDIAAGQVLKGSRAVKAIDVAVNGDINAITNGASESIKNLSKSSKILEKAGKVVNFTADHINPIICVAGGAKVLGSEDKVDAAARESLALSSMFAAEAGAKKLLGMPGIKIENGKKIPFTSNALYEKNKYLKSAAEKFGKYCTDTALFNNKVPLKCLPGAMKGVGFVTASILGYKAGTKVGNMILGEPETTNVVQNET